MRKWRETGSLEAARIGGHRRRKLVGHADWLHGVMASEPDITLRELQARLGDDGVTVSQQTINDMLRHLGYSFKKNSAGLRTGPARYRGQAAAVAQLADLAEA